MSNMKKDEMQLLKCVSIKVQDDIVLLATLQNHTENNELGKTDRSKSIYRWLARIDTVDNISKCIEDMKADENRLKPWMWPDDPSWNGKMLTKDSTNYAGSEWLRIKLKKAVDWELGMKILNGWEKCHNEYNLKARYEIDGYLDPDGNTVSLSDREALLKLVGKNLLKTVMKKTKSKLAENATA